MAKTLFKSSDKSNFILNMTEDQYAKIAAFAMFAACAATSVATIIPEVNDSISYNAASTGLTISGVFGMIAAVVALLKKYIKGSLLVPVLAFGAMLGWGALSLANSYDTDISLYGFPQRGEGLLAIMYYFGFFVAAASVRREKAARFMLYAITGVGLLNAVWAMIQIFTGKLLFYSYTDISLAVMAVTPSGLAQSPVFLSMLLCLAMAAALTISAVDENRMFRISAACCAALFAFVMVFTRTFAGICGVVLGVIAGTAIVIVRKRPKLKLLSVLAVVLAAVLGIVIAGTVKSGVFGGYHLYDGYIIWSDDAYQRVSSSGNYNQNTVEIEDTLDVYTYLNEKTFDIIKDEPAFGTGPEQLVYPQLYTRGGLAESAPVEDYIDINKGTFDKVYNEYLYTAATRGIPSALLLIAVLISVFLISRKKLREDKSGISTGYFLITVCGILMFLITCSNITSSPVLWVCAGLACAQFTAAPKVRKAKKTAEQAENKDEAKADEAEKDA